MAPFMKRTVIRFERSEQSRLLSSSTSDLFLTQYSDICMKRFALYYISCVWPSKSSTITLYSFLLLLSFPPISISDVSFLVTLPNCVWAVICHVPLSVAKMRWQGPSGSSHYTTWTSDTYIMAGLEKELGDGRKLYTAREYTRQKLTEILQPKREELH